MTLLIWMSSALSWLDATTSHAASARLSMHDNAVIIQQHYNRHAAIQHHNPCLQLTYCSRADILLSLAMRRCLIHFRDADDFVSRVDRNIRWPICCYSKRREDLSLFEDNDD
jgi:hypothetical protein